MNRLRGCFLWLMILLVLVLGVVGAGYWYLGPYPARSPETFVDIEHGMSSRQIADLLAERGVVRSRWAFLAARTLHPSAPLQAGEYRFGPEQTPWEVFDKVRRGDIYFQYLTVPEGSNMFDIANLLSTELDTIHPDDFIVAASDPQMIHDLDPQAPTLEGYLFPSTYQVTHRTTAKQLCRMMTREFRKQWAVFGNSGQAVDVHKTVTLASLVEKESALPGERPLVSSVFMNRLRLGMPLQCDPTTVYAAVREKRYSGVIHQSDLASKDLYNTYTHSGLPPGPISNPGTGALKAALEPAQTALLYFVAKPDGSGSHHFSATLDEHEKAVLAYRKGAR